MRPRCAHDLKPMCYLLQSLTEQLLDDKIAFAAEEREALRKELRKKSDRLDAYVRACGADAPLGCAGASEPPAGWPKQRERSCPIGARALAEVWGGHLGRILRLAKLRTI